MLQLYSDELLYLLQIDLKMIKSIIQKIMIKQFSKYINGIQYNKLTIQVLGGYFSIENISLNHEFFNALQTPLNITYSHIGKLSIQAPLTKISSVPVSCTIEDVYVIAQHKRNCVKSNQISKQQLLGKYIKETFEILSDKMKDAKKQDGMFDKLGKKIIDNLKLQIKNIHIRFEQTNELHSYSFGLSLKSLTFGTTDKNWKPVFIERQKIKQDQPVFKCMNIQNFKLYWQSISKQEQKQYLFLKIANNNTRIQSMRKFVTNDKDSVFNISSNLKLKINPSNITSLPLFQLGVELEPINIKFTKQKVIQTLDFITSCIKFNEIMLKTLLDKALKKLTHDQQKKYKPICASFVSLILEKQKKKNTSNQNFKQLFDSIAIQHLYQLSMPYIKEKIQQQRQKQIKKQKKSWFSSNEVQLTSQQKTEIQKILNDLAQDSLAKGRPQQSLFIKLNLQIKGISLIFYDENKMNKLKKVELKIEDILCILQKSQNKNYFSIQNKIKKIVADITIEQNGQQKKIQLMQNSCERQNQYLIELIYRENVSAGKKTTINYFTDLSIKKTLFTYKKQYWKMFNSFFSFPQINQQVQNQAMGKLELLKKESSQDQTEQIEIQKFYNINLNLNSPTFILPLTNSTYWYLDLGKIGMKSETMQNRFVYPFKLTQLSMRYISKPFNSRIISQVLKESESFAIIKNIDIDVNMVSYTNSKLIQFEILLDKIELNATKQQFINLMNIKKFFIGEETDQIQKHNEKIRIKQQLIKKKRIDGKILKRNKYFYNWIEFYCLLSNNNLYFYQNQRDLIPQNIISLRGLKTKIKDEQNQSILQIAVNGQIFYLQFNNMSILQLWQGQMDKNVLQLKDFHSLLLQNNEQKRQKRKRQDYININLKLRQMNWNYLNEKGQFFLKIEMRNIQLQALQRQQNIQTLFNINRILIVDKVFQYKNKKYQDLFIVDQISLNISKTKDIATKIKPTAISIKVTNFLINWKPDVLLLFIHNIKQFLNIKPIQININQTKKDIVQSIKNDPSFNHSRDKYIKSATSQPIKQKRQNYLKMNQKNDQIYVNFTLQVTQLNINFIHRQSHMPMFWFNSNHLTLSYTSGKFQKFVQGSIKTVQLYQISGYPQKKYDIDVEYEPFCLVRKKAKSSQINFIEFRYSSYEAEQIANIDRVDSFLSLSFSPITLNYIQQVFLRLIDYFNIQIILLLTHSQVVAVNEDILKQIGNNTFKNEKPKMFLQNQFELVVKKYLLPYFMDFYIEIKQPQIILSPTKKSKDYLSLLIQNIMIENKPIKSNKRFENIKYQFIENIYQQQIQIKGTNIIINTINSNVISSLVEQSFNLHLVVNRLLFEDEINQITPQIMGYDRGFKIDNKISAIKITELSRYVYQNILRLPNFNLNFEDQNGQLFIHNYRITKVLAPKPIRYKQVIQQISITAKHTLQQSFDLKLWSVALHNFELEMARDEKLNIIVEIIFSQAKAETYEYKDLRNMKQFEIKPLASIKNIKKNMSYLLIKMPNTGIIDIQAAFQICEFNLNFGTLPLIADWVQPDDSVFAISKKDDRLIKFLMRLPRVIVSLQQKDMYGQSIKMGGQLIIDASRKNGESENYLRSGYDNKSISPNYIEQLNQFMTLKVMLGLQFYTTFKETQRKILDRVKIQLKQQYFYKIRNDQFRKTVRRRLNISQLKGSLSVDDVILFKAALKSKSQGESYEKQFKQILKQGYMKSEKDDQKIIYKDTLGKQKILQQFVFNIENIKFYLIHKQKSQYIPILRICSNNFSILQFVNKNNQVYNGQMDIQASYFNNLIFRWEPLMENTKIKLNLTNDFNTQKNLEAEISKQIYINISSEMAVSIKKALKCVDQKILQYNQGNYQPEQGLEYQSRYVIKNLTGYPIQIYDQTHKSQYFIMHDDQINYFTKTLQQNFFEQNQIKQKFSFMIHHPSYQMLQVTNISLQSQKSFKIELYDTKGRKLPQHCQISISNEVDGYKKILSIKSNKFITDYSQNILIKNYYPFDIDPAMIFTQGTHKGMKVNFYGKTQSERFLYTGFKGNLIIRKKYLVYNYTVIPLQVGQNVVIPGQFVGINESLTIQGLPYRQSFLKVVFNQIKQEYYIYSLSYIVDYTGLDFVFDKQYEIKQRYSYQLSENGKNVRIYLLPDINFEFYVRLSKSSTNRKLNGKLTKQSFEITDNNTTFRYVCNGKLESFCKNNIKDFKKIIEITHAQHICNDTGQNLVIKQVNSIEKQKIILNSGQHILFNWPNKFLGQLLCISIIEKDSEWLFAPPLPIDKNVDSFIVRNKKHPQIYKIFAIELQQTDNLTFIHIIKADHRYQIINQLSNVNITLYQAAIFENKGSQYLSKDIDPSLYTYQLQAKTKKYFGFQLPAHSKQITIHFQSTANKQDTQLFTIDAIQKNVIEKNVQLFKSKQKICVKLQFNKKSKQLRFFVKRKEIFKKAEQLQARIKIKGIVLSLIGTHQDIRKQLINTSISNISLQLLMNNEFSELGFQMQSIRIQNTIKPEPYFISLFNQQETENKIALKFALKRSRFNPKLIYYIGFSMRKSIITITSQEIQILEENINTIMQKINAKSDTNILINYDQKFKPSKIVNSSKLYFVEAELHPMKFIVTYKHVNNWGGALLKALSINNCKMTVNGKKITNFDALNLLQFASTMGKYFKQQFQNQIFSMIGSLALLGSPLNLASKIGCGLQNLIELPADGFEDDGVLGIGKGLALGTGSLISNTVEGAFGSVQSITGAIGQGISGLASYDKEFEKTRQQIKNQRVDHVGEGLLSGGKSIVNGLFTGITGLVTEPFKGAQKEGLGGFFKGGFKGLTGLIVKPVTGVIDATSKTAEGIKNTTKVFSKQTKEAKIRKYNPRPFYGYYREIRAYDPTLAKLNKQIALYSPKYSNLSWSNAFQMKNGELVILTYEYLLIISKKQRDIKSSLDTSQILMISSQLQKITIIARNDQQQKQKIQVQPKEYIKFNSQLVKIHRFYTQNYEIGVDRKLTPK